MSQNARDLMESDTKCFYSVVSLWEIAIKQNLGELESAATPAVIDKFCKSAGCIEMPLTVSHIECLRSLLLIHRDPFDRILISQAVVEKLTIITKDSYISQYSVPTIW